MKIVTTLVGLTDHTRTLEWPEGWPVPTQGDAIDLPGISEPLSVRTVVWYPEGEDDDPPFVYIVIGPPRP